MAPAAEPDGAAPVPEADYVGTIQRAGLVMLVDRGLGYLLSRVQLTPVLEQGRFVGFRVTEIHPAWGHMGLAVGDVIVRLNGHPIQRPEQAQLAYDSLRTASEVRLKLLRAGAPSELRFLVE